MIKKTLLKCLNEYTVNGLSDDFFIELNRLCE